MKMAKASKADIDMAMELTVALDSLTARWSPMMPAALSGDGDDDDIEHFDRDNIVQCQRVLHYLLDLADRASLMRVVFGMTVLLDPRNKIVDPESDVLEHHPEVLAALGGPQWYTKGTNQGQAPSGV
jgi:hypothetical protein